MGTINSRVHLYNFLSKKVDNLFGQIEGQEIYSLFSPTVDGSWWNRIRSTTSPFIVLMKSNWHRMALFISQIKRSTGWRRALVVWLTWPFYPINVGHSSVLGFTVSVFKGDHLWRRAADNQSMPSKIPSPDMALQPWTYHGLCRIWRSCNLSVISDTLMALGKSCLLANTSKVALSNSGSSIMRCNSSRAETN